MEQTQNLGFHDDACIGTDPSHHQQALGGVDEPHLNLARAEGLLRLGRWEDCISLLEAENIGQQLTATRAASFSSSGQQDQQARALSQPSSSGHLEPQAQQAAAPSDVPPHSAWSLRRLRLLAVASVHLHGRSGDWSSVLRMPPPSSEVLQGSDLDLQYSRDIRRQYRRMSILVHPDKNPGLPHAASAFKMVADAQRRLLEKGGEGGAGSREAGDPEDQRAEQRPGKSWEGRRPKRRRYASGEAGHEEGDGRENEDVWVEEGYEWWSEWDPPSGQRRASSSLDCRQPQRGMAETAAEADIGWLQSLSIEVSNDRRSVS